SAPAAIEPGCVTYGGTHSYQNCPATSENDYRDNIQEYVSQAATANYNQGNTGFRPQMVANQIRPLGFPPYQNHQKNSIGGTISIKTEEVISTNLISTKVATSIKANFIHPSYIKANDAVLRNMQSQGQNVQNQCQRLQTQIANLTDMLSKFVSSNTASSSRSGTLPSNTVTNPKEDLKGITTRSGVAYQGPTIPTQFKVMKQRTEVTKDQVQTSSSQSTAPVQTPVVQTKTQTPVFEPVVAPVSAPMPNLNSFIPYPSRRDNERRRMDECLALADLGASINLMPLSVWEGLSLPKHTPTCMTLKLADRSVSKPIGIAKDVSVKVGVFHFPA
nr:reverse transcriptase domain-containing protein [Tanacetum cinerariifolium]